MARSFLLHYFPHRLKARTALNLDHFFLTEVFLFDGVHAHAVRGVKLDIGGGVSNAAGRADERGHERNQ